MDTSEQIILELRAALERKSVELQARAESGNAQLKEISRINGELVNTQRELANAAESTRQDAERVKACETRFQRLFESSKEGILILDAETGTIEDVNPFLCHFLGYLPDDFIGKQLWEIGTFRDIAANQDGFRTLQEQEHVRYEDLPLGTQDGQSVSVEFVSNVYVSGDRKVIQCNIRDITQRKLAEEQLRIHARLLSVVGQAVIVTDQAGTLTYWSDSAESLYGWSSSEVLGRNILDVTPSDATQQQAAEIMACLTRGETWSGEFIAQKRDGTTLPIYVTNTPVRDEDGHVVSIIGLSLDITERRQVEASLRESEERYRAFIATSSEAIWRLELEQPIPISLSEDEQIERFYRHSYLAECNDAMAQMYGFSSAQDIVGARMDQLLVRSDPANIAYLTAFIHSNYRLHDAESHEMDAQGQTKYFLNNLIGIIEDGAFQRGWGTQRDITQRKQVEEALSKSEAEFRTLAEALPQIVWVTRPDGWHIHFNQRWTDYTGLSLEESLGFGWNPPFHPDDRPRAARLWEQATRSGEPYEIEYRLRRADGVYRWMLGRALPMRDDTGALVKWFGTCTDIDDQKQAEQCLRESEEYFRFLNDLAEATRPLVDAEQVMAVTARMLGEHLSASRCAYADVEPDGDRFTILHDYTDGCASTVGKYQLSPFGPRAVATLGSGKTLIIRDVEAELLPNEGAEMFNAIGIQAVIVCPLVKEGVLRAMMAVHQTTPRAWQPSEITLVQDVVERCWATVERRTAEERILQLNTELEQRVMARR